MRSFLKFFLAAFVALVIFSVVAFLLLMGAIGVASSPKKVVVPANSVLVLETSQTYKEQHVSANPINNYIGRADGAAAGLYDAVRLIQHAAYDDNIKGIYIKVDGNGSGFATNEELRNALAAFKKTDKFVYAYGEVMSQHAYYLASVADKIYLNPKGGLEFSGFAVQYMYLKGLLEKLEIEPQIFYDGKFKSATEPLRETQMTEANRVQTTAFLSQLYGHYLQGVSEQRKVDTASLHRYANDGLIQEPSDALHYKLVDGLKYDDQVLDELRKKLNIDGKDDKVNFVSLNEYDKATDISTTGDNKIALIYAQGDIVSGNTEDDDKISSGAYIKMIRNAREDDDIKAIVFRVNSGGGSALASEVIWRELSLAKKVKPVVVSMGDYAASGGYYISCMADSIFAQPNTLTGSIGVFAVLPNLGGFFKNKLGVTFDGVKTAQYADLGTMSRPMNDAEKHLMQQGVDSTYASFKSRVVAGRKLSGAVVDSIAQGRVWSGEDAKRIGLVDRIGGIQDAIACAARLSHAGTYQLEEYPDVKNQLGKILKLLGMNDDETSTRLLKKELGDHYEMYIRVKRLKEMSGQVEARMPFDLLFQ
ncbi:protease-4 [Chitinophaga costaii]|uniref:Protease-4 n=1 Tax=Chitinophaga costaii TaxID=1335309 RepID=A0A1C4EP95_9BACT|nr:signal peptide peptidase SppA [Chitinophaga costaii]PUZ22487.1 signal peptide peptidase SppA [Chitinophaga costaii]SCC45391.1 protease-4 [Chitinophaga costaii]